MKEKIKNRLIFFLKYAVGFALLGWAAWRFDFTQIVDTIGSISITALLASLFLSVLSLTQQFQLRWKTVRKNVQPGFHAHLILKLKLAAGLRPKQI